MNGQSQVLPGGGHASREGINMAAAPRTVLISGCSSGIGLELAVQLAHDPKKRYQGKRCRAALGGSRVETASPALSPLPVSPSCTCGLGENSGCMPSSSPSRNHPLILQIFLEHLLGVLNAGNTTGDEIDKNLSPRDGVMRGGERERAINRYKEIVAISGGNKC